jgi:hypothetical protein
VNTDRLHSAAEEHYAHDEALIATAERLAAENEQLHDAVVKALAALTCPEGPKPGLAEFILTRAALGQAQR